MTTKLPDEIDKAIHALTDAHRAAEALPEHAPIRQTRAAIVRCDEAYCALVERIGAALAAPSVLGAGTDARPCWACGAPPADPVEGAAPGAGDAPLREALDAAESLIGHLKWCRSCAEDPVGSCHEGTEAQAEWDRLSALASPPGAPAADAAKGAKT